MHDCVESNAAAAQTEQDAIRSYPRKLDDCGMTDEDLDDLTSCLDAAGRENIEWL